MKGQTSWPTKALNGRSGEFKLTIWSWRYFLGSVLFNGYVGLACKSFVNRRGHDDENSVFACEFQSFLIHSYLVSFDNKLSISWLPKQYIQRSLSLASPQHLAQHGGINNPKAMPTSL